LDQGETQVADEELRRVHIAPYLPAIAEGVGSIMISYNSWNGQKCTGYEYLITDILKGELGFEGLVISDWNAIDQVDADYKTAIKQSINAGVDVAMVPDKYQQFVKLLTELVNEGKVPMERIDDAVRRILIVKAAMGLLNADRSHMADRGLHESFGSQERRDVARQAVRESLVLLKNDNNVLPLSKDAAKIHVTGSAADDVGVQCGGWTIEWQGKAGQVTTGGTTILRALQQALGDSKISYSADGSGAEGADVCVVVVGEQPYAEGAGDDEHLKLSDEDLQTFRTAKAAGTPTVVVLISGRPMVIDEVLDDADAVVAAWLPGTEGRGVADVLLGDHTPDGKLSFSWPRTADQHPINVGDENYNPLFEFGFGLTYED
jgi:beta-glucosidase